MKGNVGMRKKNDTKEENGKLLLSVKETCELTGLSEKTVRTIMAENDFCVRIRTLVGGTGHLNIF